MMHYIYIVLAMLVVFLLIRELKETFVQTDPYLDKMVEKVYLVEPKAQGVGIYTGDSSYTIDKQRIHVCIRKDNGQYWDENTLMHVILHELAHVLNTQDVGHTENFHRIFQDLLDRAHRMGMYNPYMPIPDEYTVDCR